MDAFRNVFITHVDKAGPILKLWAQLDRDTPTLIERTINQLTEQFNVGIGLPDASALEIGKLVCAKYSDGVYYRARILSLANMAKGEVYVQFADYGNFETIDVINLRVLEGFASSLSTVPDQAIDLYLAGIVSPGTEWCPTSLKFVKDTICYVELKCQFVGQVANKRLIKLFYENMDFVDCLMERSIGYSILMDLQKTLLGNYLAKKVPQQHHPMFPNYNPDVPPPLPHAPMMPPHLKRSTDAAMQESMVRAALQARQESMTQKAPNVHPPPGMAQPNYPGYTHPVSQYALAGLLPPPSMAPPRVNPPTPEPPANSGSFVNTVLKPGTQYEVRVTAVTDGPYAFCVTLKEMESTLHKLLITINSTPPTPLMTFPMVGTRCFARSTQGKNLCRAVIKNIVHDTCTVYYVDYGNSEDISLADVYEIPSNYVGQPPVMALQFTHGGLGTLEVTKDIKDMFKKYTSGKLFSLFVIPTESHAMEQYGILYENKRGVIDIILDKIEARNSMTFTHLPMLAAGANKMVVVSFVESVNKFFVQLEDNLPTIESLMNELMLHCKNNASPIGLTDLRVRLLCCAKFHADDQWYRAEVVQVTPEGIHVNYVDFGNVELVQLNALMTITPELVTCLPVQSMQCALVDYLKAPHNEAMINEFVALTDSKSLVMKVMSHCKNGTLAVHLTDVSNTLPVLIDSALEKYQQPTKDTSPAGAPAKPAAKVEDRGVYRAPSGPLAATEPRSSEYNSHGAGDGKYQRQGSRPAQHGSSNPEVIRPAEVQQQQPLQQQQQQRPNKKRRADASSDWRAKDGGDAKWRGEPTSAPRVFTPASVSVGDTKAAQLVFVESPESFYLQLTPDLALADVMADIATKYESGSSRPLRPATPGAACVARFAEDATWYRAVVRSVAQGKARVQFVDYGNEDEVALEDVREIDPAFMQFPSQGIKCALAAASPSAGAWSDAEIEKFTALADGKPLEVRFVAERGDTFMVTVKDAETDTIVNKAFGPQELKPKTSYNEKPKTSYDDKPRNSYDDKPRNSYDDKPKTSYDDKPRNSYDDKPRNSYDDKPRNSYDDKPKTSYDNKPRNSYDDKPRNSYDDKPRNSYDDKPKASYDDKPRNNWDDKPKGGFDDKPAVRKYDDKPKPPPQVFASRDQHFTSEEFDPADTEDVCVSWFISPGQFFVQRLSKCDLMEKTMEDIQCAYRSTPANGAQLEVGAACIAKYKADGSLCRAEVMAREGAFYIVRYVDFGNRDRLAAADMWQVETKFLTLPRQAVECELAGVKPPGGEAWPKSTDDVAKMFEREKYECVFHEADEGGKYRVTLSHDGASVADELVGAGLATVPAPPEPPAPEEPVPRPLLAGQTLKAAVTYVEGVGRFCVHLENGRAAEVQAQVDQWVTVTENLSALLPAADVTVGQLCLATADAEHWYRARIVDPAGTLGVYVVFIDYGDGDEVAPDKMVVIPDWLAVLPGQAVECSLSGAKEVTVDPEVEDQFKADLEGESVIIHVEAVAEDDTLLVGVYGMDGVKLALVAHVGAGTASVPALLPAPVLAQKSRVFVSSTEGDDHVWLQRADDADAIADLLTLLYTHYQEEGKGESVTPTVGLVCAAKSAADEQWYRSRVSAVADAGVTVQYVDYGNSELVPAANLRALDPLFLASHCAALGVALPVVNESAVVVDLPTVTADVEYVAVFARRDDAWIAELFYKREALSDVLQELGMDIVEDYPFAAACEELSRSPPLVAGDAVDVFVSHTAGPAEIWIQRASDATDIEILQADLQCAAEIMLGAAPEVGRECAAMFSEDDAWYRATVLSAEGNSATVRFLDYGNTDEVNVAANPLKELTPRLAKRQHFALRCQLNVLPRGDEFSPAVAERLAAILAVTADAVPCEVLFVDEEICVDLTVAGKSLTRTLIDEGLVDEKFPEDAVFVSHAVTPAEFWIQHLAASGKLDAMIEQLVSAAEFEPLSEPPEGTLCAAQFVDDEQWYRARTMGTTEDGTSVHFVDYGNSAIATELRGLPEPLVGPVALARRCSLGNRTSWTEEQASKFLEMAAEGATLFTIAVLEEGEVTKVKLADDVGQDVEELLAAFDPETSVVEAPAVMQGVETKEIVEESKDVETKDDVQMPQDVETEEVVEESQDVETKEVVEESQDVETEEVVEIPQDVEAEEVVEMPQDAETFEIPQDVDTKDDVEMPQDVQTMEVAQNKETAAIKEVSEQLIAEDPTTDSEEAAVNAEETVAEIKEPAIQKEPAEMESYVAALAAPKSRPHTPYEDRIVPGSICRGVSDEELMKYSFQPIEDVEREIPEEVSHSCPVTPVPRPRAPSPVFAAPSPVKLQHNERIVPGCISHGSSEEVSEVDGKAVATEEILPKSTDDDSSFLSIEDDETVAKPTSDDDQASFKSIENEEGLTLVGDGDTVDETLEEIEAFVRALDEETIDTTKSLEEIEALIDCTDAIAKASAAVKAAYEADYDEPSDAKAKMSEGEPSHVIIPEGGSEAMTVLNGRKDLV